MHGTIADQFYALSPSEGLLSITYMVHGHWSIVWPKLTWENSFSWNLLLHKAALVTL